MPLLSYKLFAKILNFAALWVRYIILCTLVFSVRSMYSLCLSLLSHFQYAEGLLLPGCFHSFMAKLWVCIMKGKSVY